MKKILLILLLYPVLGFSQLDVDNHWDKWENTANQDTVRLNAILEIIWDDYLFSDTDSAIYLTQQYLEFSQNAGNKSHEAYAFNTLGVAQYFQGNISNAITFYNKSYAIRASINDLKGLSSSLNNLGNAYFQIGDYDNAMSSHLKNLKISEHLDLQNMVGSALSGIASIFNEQGDLDQALSYYKKSLRIQEEIGNKRNYANTLVSIGSISIEKDSVQKALKSFNESIIIYEEIGDLAGQATSLNSLGHLFIQNGEKQKALDFFNKSLNISENIGHKGLSIRNYRGISLVYEVKENYNTAIKYGNTAFDLSLEIDEVEVKVISAEALWRLYKITGNHKKSLEMHEAFIFYRDSMLNEQNQKAVIQQEFKYKFEKKQVKINAQHQVQLLKQETEALSKQKQQKIILAVVISGLILLTLFVGFIINRLRITKLQKNEIFEQKSEIESQKEIVEYAHKEISDSINYAERIQCSFLATKELLDENLNEHFVFFKPKEAVSGDFYWAEKLSNGTFAMVNADSTGHGVPGAIMSILNISSIEKAVKEGSTAPHEIFNKTRRFIIDRLKKDGSSEGGKDGMDASIICFDFENNKFTYTAAQNPIWIIRDGQLTEIKPEKMPIGKHNNDHIPFIGGEFEMQKGDQVYTLTDGFQDQFGGPKGKKFMVKKMREYVLSISHLSLEEQHQKIKEAFTNWKGNIEQVDDVCVIGVKI